MGINITKYLLSALLLMSSLTAFSFDQPRRHLMPSIPKSHRAAEVNRTNIYTGEKRQLVVLASFSDLDFRQAEPLPIWERIFNEPNFKEDSYYGSVHDYFYDQSNGKFKLQFDLYAIKVNNEHAVYRSTDYDDSNAALLIIDLVNSLKDIITDWAPYDWDNDGNIDQLFVLYAGMGQSNGGDRNTIWPNQASLRFYDHDPITVSSNGKDYYIDKYGCFPEYGNISVSFGTLCHEFGHCLGLPDFYYDSISILDSWDIMDHGNYNNNGYCPPCYSAQERMLLGWLDVTELTEPTSIIDMPALSDAPVAYMIRNDNYPDEYYILENRQKKGWDQSLPGSGLVIFHIDYDKDRWTQGIPNTYVDKCYAIIPANGFNIPPYWPDKASITSGWAYPYGTKDSLTNNSNPAATLRHAAQDGTKLMSKPITNIRVDNGLVSFDFMGGSNSQTAIQSQTSNLKPQIKEVYDLSGRQIPQGAMGTGIYIIKYANGQTRKVVCR